MRASDNVMRKPDAEGQELWAGRNRSHQSSATLVCDYSEHELQQLLVNTSEAMGVDLGTPGADARKHDQSASRPLGAFGSDHGSASNTNDSPEKYNLLTRLNDEEENVDFMQMFHQYQMQKQQNLQPPQQMAAEASATPPSAGGPSHQVQYFNQANNEYRSERVLDHSYAGVQSQPLIAQHQSQRANPNNRMSAGPMKGAGYMQLPERQPQRQGKLGAIRPGSATVAGQGGRFLANQNSRKRYEQVPDQISFSYQQPLPLVNTLVGKGSPTQAPYGQVGTQRHSSSYGLGQQTSLMKPPFGQRKRTRPQSAARNQLQPAKNLQSVTNFTYQKAKQNQNQKAYVPDSMKHTDKERLYEEKIELQKQVNQMAIANQQLKTQVQSQHAHIRQKDDMIQQVMQQVFVPAPQQVQSDDQFLQQFQEREINHNIGQKAAMLFAKGAAGVKFKAVAPTKMTKQSALAAKDSQISALKLKIKELNEQIVQRDKELADLKQTLKFTKIKEYETELALNVQESQRLRVLLEREISKPKTDPALVQGLRQQSMQQQQIIQNMQRNSQIQQENYEKLNKKMVAQIKKHAKLKEARKKLAEKSIRNEKKVLILNRKARQLEADLAIAQRAQQQVRNQRARHASVSSQEQQQQFNEAIQKYQQRFNEQNKLIEKLILIMQDNGIEINEEDLTDEKEEAVEGVDPTESQQAEAVLEDERPAMDLVVTFGGQNVSGSAQSLLGVTKELKDTDYETFDELREELRKAFSMSGTEELVVKHVGDDGAAVELQHDNWQELRAAQQQSDGAKVQLLLELASQDAIDEEPSNYDDDDFEEQVSEKVFLAPITFEEVKGHFDELRLIFMIKKVKKEDALKYLLHGLKDEETGKKVKKVTIKNLADCFDKKIQFPDKEVSMKLAKYLIEQPNEDGKVEQKDDAEFKGQTHAEAVSTRRKDLLVKFNDNLKNYPIFNGLAITSLLTQIHNMFESVREELGQDLEDQDSEDEGTASMEQIWKRMQIAGLYPPGFDDDVRDFLLFLAMRHSKSLSEVDFKRFMKAFEEDYNLLEDGPSRWESSAPYTPSEDEGELESDKPPEPEVEEVIEEMEPVFDQETAEEASAPAERSQGNVQDLEQNELLEKVDEILMQIVQRLPPTQKIRTLTHLMLPFLTPVYDQEKQRQFLIISQGAFIQFLLGQNKHELGLQLEESHVVCLLHLLVQEDEDEQQESGSSEPQADNKFILYDEFIELVKTYMKKELIMQQSKSLGIHYDVLGKESVEFLFQVRSSLMYDGNQNINENSADEDDEEPSDANFGGRRTKKQKSVPTLIREIFARIVQRKNIQLNKSAAQQRANRAPGAQVEVMDFDQMVDVLAIRLGIPTPSAQSQEELKFLMCLDFKYLEMVMLIKLDKVMQDLDYISIDLLRHAQDRDMEQSRQMAISGLRKIREEQLGTLKNLQVGRHKGNSRGDPQGQNEAAGYQGAQSSQLEVQGVSHSSQQEKKRKRPDDKRQNVAKKAGGGRTQQQQYQLGEQDQFANSANSGPRQNFGSEGRAGNRSKTKGNFDQDHSAAKSGATQNSMAKDRYAPSQGSAASVGPLHYQVSGQDRSAHQGKESASGLEVERSGQKNAASQRERQSKLQQQDQAIDEDIVQYPARRHPQVANTDFDNIDVNLDVDIHRTEKPTQNKQMQIVAEIVAAANTGSEFDEENLQDDIPIDDCDDEDGIISDHYENYTDAKKPQAAPQKSSKGPDMKKESSAKVMNSALDENAFSMDHSDDLEASPQMRVALQGAHEQQQMQSFNQKQKLKQPPAVGTRPAQEMNEVQQLIAGMESDMSSDEDIDEEQLAMDMDDYPSDDGIEDEVDDDGPPEEDAIQDDAIDDFQRIETRIEAQLESPTEVEDEVVDQSPENEIEDSDDDVAKASNDDIPAQVAQGRLNFNKFGKDSSIQQENAHGQLDEDDFEDQSSQRSPQKEGPAAMVAKKGDQFYGRPAEVEDEVDEEIGNDSESKEVPGATPKASEPEEYIIDEDEKSMPPEEVEENLSSASPQQIAQDTKEPEGRRASSGGGESYPDLMAVEDARRPFGSNVEDVFKQDGAISGSSNQQMKDQSRLTGSRGQAAAFEENYGDDGFDLENVASSPSKPAAPKGAQGPGASMANPDKKSSRKDLKAVGNVENSDDYSGAFDDDYEI